MAVPLEVFCCYAREDQEMLQHLKKHLMPLQRSGQITIWSDTNLSAGAEWEKELHQHLESADIILLLISPDFMASDYCYSTEMGRAIVRHNDGSTQVIPLLLRPVHWDDAPFAQLQVIPTNAEPITRWANRDDAFHDTVKHINRVITDIKIQRALLEAGEYASAIRYQEALACYEQVLRLNSVNGSALFGRAGMLYHLGQIDASIEVFTLAEQTVPTANDVLSSLLQADALKQRKRYAESLAVYDQALSFDPNNAQIHIEKATILLTLQTYDQALKAFERAQVLQPNQVEYYTQAGNLLFRLRRFEQALAMYEQASKLQPGEANYYEWQGQILLHLQRHEDALAAYQQVLAISPQLLCYEQAGKLLLQLSRYQEALEMYEQALKMANEDNPSLYVGKGQALLCLERYDEALTCYQTAIKLSAPETDPQFYHDLGMLLERWAQSIYTIEQQKRLLWHPEIDPDIFLTPAFDPTNLKLLHTLSGHTGVVWSIAFSPDGTILASGSVDKAIKLWDMSSKRELLTLTGHTHEVLCVAFSPDGKTLASASGGTTVKQAIKLWDVPSGRELQTLTGHTAGIYCVTFSPDSTLFASAGDKTIRLWDVPSGRELHTFTASFGSVVAFSPDGIILASTCVDEFNGRPLIKFWDVSSGQELYTLTDPTKNIRSIAFSPDGITLADSEDKTVKLWGIEP